MAIGIICNAKVDSRAPVCQQPGLPMWPFAFHTPRQKIVHGTQLSLALSHRHMKACNLFCTAARVLLVYLIGLSTLLKYYC